MMLVDMMVKVEGSERCLFDVDMRRLSFIAVNLKPDA